MVKGLGWCTPSGELCLNPWRESMAAKAKAKAKKTTKKPATRAKAKKGKK
jgi:hypothetical protein